MNKIQGETRTQLAQIMSLQNSNGVKKIRVTASYSVLMLLFYLRLGLPS